MDELNTHLTIKSLAEDDRPREKLLSIGSQNLSDAELLAIIIGSGSRNETVLQLSQRILNNCSNNISNLAKMQLNDLKKFKGVGTAKAVSIAAAMELGRRRNSEDKTERITIQSSYDAYKLLQKKVIDLPHEEFWVVFLNRSNTVIKLECISKGGISGTIVDVRLILKPAIDYLASGVVLCHNHPSGSEKPSQQDIDLTRKTKEALKLMDISLLDHVIISDKTYFSFADEGIL